MTQILNHGSRMRPFLRIVILIVISLIFLKQWNVVDSQKMVNIDVGSVELASYYQPLVWRFTIVDLTIGLLILVLLPSKLFSPQSDFRFLFASFIIPLALCLLISIVIAIKNQVATPLYGIRPIAIFVSSCFIGAHIARQVDGISLFLKYFVRASILVSLWYLIRFAAGQGDATYFMRVPTYDGATLLTLLFGNLLGIYILNSERSILQIGRRSAWALVVLTTACLVMSFARAVWIGMLIQTLLFFFKFSPKKTLSKRNLNAIWILGAVSIIWIFVELMFSSFMSLIFARLRSMLFFHSSAIGALGGADNADHLRDIYLGIQQVRRNWIWGDGAGSGFNVDGVSYKSFTVGLHNTPLTIWLWFGLFGLLLWLAYSLRIFQLARRETMHSVSDDTAQQIILLKVVAVWWCTNVLLGFFFSAWFLSLTQVSVFSGFVTGISAIRTRL